MVSKQFRIGNYYLDIDNKLSEMSGYDLHQITIKENTDNLGCLEYEQINISEKWLFDLGFEKINYKKFWGQPYYKKGIYIYLEDGEFRFYRHSNRAWTIYDYVNEIQNLYYCLSGEELEYKPL